MTFGSCSREKEVTQALKDGHWPDGCEQELRAHVEACPSCGDVVLVTQIFQRARSESVQAVPSVSPGLIWWRSHLRRRNAATELASKPITIAQVFAWLVVVLVGVFFVASQYRHGMHWASWGLEVEPSRTFHVWSLAAAKLDWNLLLLVPGLGALALMSGVVLYVLAEKR
ncbi:MAG TPA: hypothetical protein VGJ16_06220 [Pirellulales bacterium]|jgi:hypothetical protein